LTEAGVSQGFWTMPKHILQDEQGLSALETAIVLIAFVVVASVFAFTMLSAGLFATDASKAAIYAALEEVRSSVALRGSVVVTATNAGGVVDTVIFTVKTVAGGSAMNLTDTSGDNVVVISYRDANQVKSGLDWSATWLGATDGDFMLEEGELAEISVAGLEASLDPDLGVNTTFAIEVKPPTGAVLLLERTTPAYIDKVMDLR